LTGENIVRDVAVAAGGGIFLPFRQRLGMGALEIALVFLGMTFLALFVVEKKSRNSAQELRVRVFHTFFFDV
jgi:hypothetical protein